jgi:nicotinate-nucleotide adenylyltransferase
MNNEKEKSRVGVLLGSFDPIHMGHLYMAASALNDNLVDRVIFVPSVQNPWKENSTDFRHRCFMVQLAIDELDHCYLSSIDFRTSEPHYSVNTLMLLKEEYPDDELYLIIGADVVDEIKNWKDGEWILENFKLIAVNRHGYEFKTAVDGYISNTLEISSTVIRYLAKEGKQLYPLVPKVVNQYIKRYNLYK